MKTYKDRSHTKHHQKKLKGFETNAQMLFYTAACRCTSACVCKCKPELRVPPEETSFLLDQRTSRKMVIGGIDGWVTDQQKKKKEIDQYERYKNRKVVESEDTFATVNKLKNFTGSCDDDDASEQVTEGFGDTVFAATTKTFDNRVTSDSCGADSDVLAGVSNDENAPSTLKALFWRVLSLPSVACELDRRNISERSGAAIVSAFLTKMGLVSTNDSSSIIDRLKI